MYQTAVPISINVFYHVAVRVNIKDVVTHQENNKVVQMCSYVSWCVTLLSIPSGTQ